MSENNPLFNPEVLTKVDVNINSSSSKQMYTFGKANRFDYRNKGNTNFAYNLPDVKSKRSAAFGYGLKTDFTRGNRDRNDSIYNLGSDFDQHNRNSHSPRYTMRPGRDICKMSNKKSDSSSSPGPSSYNPYKPFGSYGPSYSMSFRYGNVMNQSKFTPGPGAYKYECINPEGKYSNGKLCNSPTSKFSINQRFKYKKDSSPGPGSYNNMALIGRDIIDSRYKTNVGKTMSSRYGGGVNGLSASMQTPGPGSYDFFSDFEGFNKKSYNFMKKKKKNGGKKNKNDEELVYKEEEEKEENQQVKDVQQ